MHARSARRVVAAAAAVGVAAAAMATWSSSTAAWTVQTESTGNAWGAGALSLEDTGTASALLSQSALLPGSTVVGCISVTYTGDLADAVLRTYSSGYQDPDATTDPDALAPYVDVVVRARDGAAAADCSDFGSGDGTQVFAGTLAALGALDSYATGFDEQVVDPGHVRSYRVSAAVQDQPAAQATTTGVSLVWEVQR